MSLQTNTQIFISGTQIPSYKNLKLTQEIDAHHDLEITFRTDVLEKISQELIGESKNHLGSTITIKIKAITSFEGYKELEFKGVIVKIQGTKGFHQPSGDIVTLHAKSTSILSDGGPHYASHNDVSLSEIIQKTFRDFDKGKLQTKFSPASSDTIQYSVQHNQSAFSYASRLASYYNEWFYYDGKTLIFGTPSTEEIELRYGVDLQTFSIELNSIPTSFNYLTNNYLTGEVLQKSSKDITIPSEGYHGFTNKKSNELFPTQTNVLNELSTVASMKLRFDRQADQYTKARVMQQVIARGSSDNPGITLGGIVKISGHGSFRVIKITHTNIEGGAYINNFEAVDANFMGYPKMDMNQYPKSDIQVATVKENNDPEGLGRVKVQFSWQIPLGEITPWLRVMTPHAGADKGFHFIPELKEEVVVDFEGGNAEKPFVAGAIYNGPAKPDSWQTDANNIKAIRTRSGHTIELNDTKGGEMIVISDKNSNIIHFDTAKSSIMISTPENLILQSKNMEIRALEDIKITAGKNKTEQITGDYKLTASNIFEVASKDMKSQGEKIIRQAIEEMNVSSVNGNVNKQADQKVNNNSGEQGNVF